MPFTATTALMIGAGVSAGAAVYTGVQARQQGKAQEDIAEANAQIAETEAAEARQAGIAEAQQFSRRARRLQATQRAAFASSGVTIEGTPTELLLQQAEELEFDRQNILRNAGTRGLSLESRAGVERTIGESAARRGRSALTGSLLGAGGTLASGFGTAKLRADRLDLINQGKV